MEWVCERSPGQLLVSTPLSSHFILTLGPTFILLLFPLGLAPPHSTPPPPHLLSFPAVPGLPLSRGPPETACGAHPGEFKLMKDRKDWKKEAS